MLRFETKQHLQELCTKVFGITARLGVRERPPKLSEMQGVNITENASINFVKGIDQSPEGPIRVRTQDDGIDIYYTKDGFVKLNVRYRCYILQYDAERRPIDCPDSDLLDLLTHFPKEQAQIDCDSSSKSDQSSAEEVDLVEEDEEDDESSIEVQSDSRSVKRDLVINLCSQSTESLSSDSSEKTSNVDRRTLTSLMNIGSCFRTSTTKTVWKILRMRQTHIEAEVVNPGLDLSIEKGVRKNFLRTDPTMLNGLLSFNSYDYIEKSRRCSS